MLFSTSVLFAWQVKTPWYKQLGWFTREGDDDDQYSQPDSPTMHSSNSGFRPNGERYLTRASTSPSPFPARPARSTEKGTPFAPNSHEEIEIGMSVLVSHAGGRLSKGILRYSGPLPEQEQKVYLGLELFDAGTLF